MEKWGIIYGTQKIKNDRMINIITGKINSGKTTKLLSLFDQNINGDGFACVKRFDNDKFLGYNILHLQTGKSIPFSYQKNCTPDNWNEMFQFGKFSFSKEGFVFADKIIDSIIKKNMEPIFIDEVGPVEILLKKGFYKIVKKVLNTNKKCFLTVRSDMVDGFCEEFGVDERFVIKITNNNNNNKKL